MSKGISQMGSQPSTMKHDFSMVPKAEIPRSSFDRSHGFKTTFDAGYLVPVFVDEALPGDTFSLNMSSFARLATPIVPIMDNMYLDSFFFAVPLRILWDNFEKFMGQQDNPGDSISYLCPQIQAPDGGPAVGSLSDYMGIPTAGTTVISGAFFSFNAFWHRAYNLIYNEWFRDQNLQDSVAINTDDGPDPDSDYVLLRRGRRHDYFTSALPWPQKGSAVTIPLGTSAPINHSANDGDDLSVYSTAHASYQKMSSATADTYLQASPTVGLEANSLFADLSSATAATINSLRQAFQIQKLLERDARGGTRYTEVIRSHFGVTSPDARLQRPEYLGGGSSQIYFTPIAQTSATGLTGSTTPQGTLAAMATHASSSKGFTKSFTEHMVIIGLVMVRADQNYQQGLNRMFSRQTRYDFYWPALSHIGEQGILNKELYLTGGGNDTDVFGYQERYAEYRYKPSQITGLFRSTATDPLDIWHLAMNYTSLPTLGDTFIQDDPPVDRIVAVTDEPQFLLDCYFKLKCARPMPTYSVPGLIDHF